MAWKETSPVQQRKQFIDEHMKDEHSIAELCRRFGVSRKTGYKWLHRFQSEGGVEGLRDRSRRPKTSPNAIEPWLEEAIVAARKRRPTWGPKKLKAVLEKENPDTVLPAASTMAAIFKRYGLVKPRRRRQRTPPYTAPLAHASAPNKLWCIDFKGQFSVGKARCYPLTVTDAHSRFLIACISLPNTRGTPVRRALESIFDEFGLPEAIRSDNGTPFAGRGCCGLSQLSAWWHKMGIRHERIEPGRPDQNGRHERMHRTLKQETANPPAKSLAAQQRAFDLFRAEFNDERPHEALGQRMPAEFYEPSRRRLPTPPWGRDFEYPLDYETTRVSKLGIARTGNGSYFVSTALRHELLGLNWSEGQWDVWFGSLLLGRARRKPRSRQVHFVPAEKVSPMSSDNPPPMSSN